MGGVLLRVGAVGALVVGGVILRPFVMGDAGSLEVGECFDPPTTIGETVEDVQHRPCTDPHGAEVVFVGDFTGTDAYPSDEDFFGFFQSTCEPAFDAYTGLVFATAEEYDMAAFTPTSEGWSSGDRKIICYAVKTDETQLTQSIKRQ